MQELHKKYESQGQVGQLSFLVYLCKNQFKLGSPKLKVVSILPTAARRSDAETKQEITLLARSLSHCFIWESLVWLFMIGLRFQFLNLWHLQKYTLA